MRLICLDIEATDNGEMLELSIFQFDNNQEIYHSYFKPENTNSWTNKVHHITPDMVKNAPSCKSERIKIQKIIDDADVIIGFALANDIKYLNRHKISIPLNIYQLDVQDWFWYYIGKENGIEFGSVPKLSKCAEILKLNFSEETEAHSATNDTKITLTIFKKILDKYNIDKITPKLIDEFKDSYIKEKRWNAEKRAKGILSLLKCSTGYILKNNLYNEEKINELSIVVNSRYIGEHEIREKFKKREFVLNSGIYILKSADIEFFLNYSNTYDAFKEDFYRKFYNAKRSRKGRLDFNIR